jgi:tRNA(fMet)-specific endonuclease VapC
VVSILFKPDHSLHQKCLRITTGNQWFTSFMTRGELLMWPRVKRWGSRRREQLIHHIDLCTTLLPDEETCVFWADIMTESPSAGRPLTAADAWVAAAALQFDLALFTADYHDFEHLDGLTPIPVSA